jgi:hypothetical protein
MRRLNLSMFHHFIGELLEGFLSLELQGWKAFLSPRELDPVDAHG